MADCQLCGRPQPDTAYVDAHCAGNTATRLGEAADLWPELLTTCAGQARMAGPGPHRRGRAPAEPVRPGLGDPADDQQPGWPAGLPPNLAAVAVRDAVRNTATTWARVIWDERAPLPYLGPACARRCSHGSCLRMLSRHTPPADTPGLLQWLAGQVEWLRHQPYAAEAMRDLRRQCGRIPPAVDQPRPRVDAGLCLAPTDAGPCPQRLSAGPAAAVIHCPACRRTWSAAERRETILAGARHLRGTAEEIAAWLSILVARTPSATVRSWAYRRRLLADRWGRYSMDTAVELRMAQADQRPRERMSA